MSFNINIAVPGGEGDATGVSITLGAAALVAGIGARITIDDAQLATKEQALLSIQQAYEHLASRLVWPPA